MAIGKGKKPWKWQDEREWVYTYEGFSNNGSGSVFNGKRFHFIFGKEEVGTKIDPETQIWLKLENGHEIAVYYAGPRKNQRIANQLRDFYEREAHKEAEKSIGLLEKAQRVKRPVVKKIPLPE